MIPEQHAEDHLARAQRAVKLADAEYYHATMQSYQTVVLMAEYRRRGARIAVLEARVGELEAHLGLYDAALAIRRLQDENAELRAALAEMVRFTDADTEHDGEGFFAAIDAANAALGVGES